MDAPNTPKPSDFERFDRLLKLAEHTGLYLDVTGLPVIGPPTFQSWCDALDESGRWTAQANFWRTVAAHALRVRPSSATT